jgi:farnesyl-diphosphate farnesyltransferase
MPEVAIVTALPEELSPLRRRAAIERVIQLGSRKCYVGTLAGARVVMMATGDGLANAEQSLRALLERFDVSSVIGAGIGGALSPELRSGDLVVATEITGGSAFPCDPSLVARFSASGAHPARLRSVPRVVATAREKQELSANGASVVDTESAGWATAASDSGIPLVVVRAIFDGAHEEVPAFVAAASTADGSIDRTAVVRHALFHPTAIPHLIGMRQRLRICAERVADLVERCVTGAAQPATTHYAKLLEATSRTFALCIPLLPEPARFQVTIAYLLFRIADTFEDASDWPVADRIAALDAFCALLRNPDPTFAQRLAADWHSKRPSSHAGYLELMADVPRVLEAFLSLSPEAIEVVRTHVIRSAEGMSKYVAMTADGTLQLADLPDLREYCYTVAGIVGEMLTELFLLASPSLAPTASLLRQRSALFGEGLQLVNILKDVEQDSAEGRRYIPDGIDRAEVFALARTDLHAATEYTLALQSAGAPRGLVAFTALPVALAQASLDRLEKAGPGAKIGRTEVYRITRRLNRALARNEPALALRSLAPSGVAWKRSIVSLLFGNGS